MSHIGAALCAAVPVSIARAGASWRNGAKSRGPRTSEGKARSAQNALKHGMPAQKYLVLPDEDAAEFAGLEAALIEELARAAPHRPRWSVLGARRGARSRRCSRGTSPARPGLARADRRPSCSRSIAAPRAGSDSAAWPPGWGSPDCWQWRPNPFRPAMGPRAPPAAKRPQRPALVRDPLAGASTDLGGRCAPTNHYRSAVMAEL